MKIKHISKDNIYKICNFYNFYTCGTREDYDNMFQFVSSHNPSLLTVYRIAKDIYEHSSFDSAIGVISSYNRDDENILMLMDLIQDKCCF